MTGLTTVIAIIWNKSVWQIHEIIHSLTITLIGRRWGRWEKKNLPQEEGSGWRQNAGARWGLEPRIYRVLGEGQQHHATVFALTSKLFSGDRLGRLLDHPTSMASQTGKISDKLGLSPKNPVFRSKNWVYQLKNWVYREKLSFSTDKPSLSINWVYQLKNLVFQNWKT